MSGWIWKATAVADLDGLAGCDVAMVNENILVAVARANGANVTVLRKAES
jgi:hypothetical protein